MLLGIDASRAARAQRTGTEGYAYYLIRELLPLAEKKGHEIRLYFQCQPPRNLFPASSAVHSLVIPWPRLWTHLRLGWELRQQPPDVFFTPAHVIPLSYHGPAVATVHDLGYAYFPEAHTHFQRIYLRWSTRHNARRSHYVLADSRATAADLAHLYQVPTEKIEVVYPGLEPHLRPVRDVAILARVQGRYGIREPYLLYLGTLQPRKNIRRLLDAFAASEVPAQLVLAGKAGWLSESITAHLAQLPQSVSEHVRVTGFIADEDKAALLSGATALLLPSLYEGFGFPVLEAQVCGTPVLCSDNSSLPEVAGDAALLVDAQDTIEIRDGIRLLMAEERVRRELVANGFRNVQRFTWKRAAQETLAVLERAAP